MQVVWWAGSVVGGWCVWCFSVQVVLWAGGVVGKWCGGDLVCRWSGERVVWW